MFEGYVQNSQLRSINTSNQPTGVTTQNNFYNAAVYNRNWQYNNQLPMTYAWYVLQLYFVKGNRNTQAAYGNGPVNTTNILPVNQNWSATNAWNTGSTIVQTLGVTALGIQNAWGNGDKFMGETRYDNGVYRFSVLGGKDHYNIQSGYASTWKSIAGNTSSGYISQIIGTPEYPFFPNETRSSGDTRYSDVARQTTSTACCVMVGGDCTDNTAAGPLNVEATYATNHLFYYAVARLHVLII